MALTHLDFWLGSAQNCRKCTFWTIYGLKETRKLDKWPHFLSTFFTLFVIFIFIFENGQDLFSSDPPLVYSGLSNTSDSHHIFLEIRQPEITKIYIMFSPFKQSQKKKYQFMD